MKSSKDWNWRKGDEDSVSLAETVLAVEFSITLGHSTEMYLFNLHIRDLSNPDNQGVTAKYGVCYWEPYERNATWLESINNAETQADVFVCIDKCVASILEGLAKELRGEV